MPPFTYEALPPIDIEFVPLKQTRSFRADALMQACTCSLLLRPADSCCEQLVDQLLHTAGFTSPSVMNGICLRFWS